MMMSDDSDDDFKQLEETCGIELVCIPNKRKR